MIEGQVLRQRYRLIQRIAAGGMGEVWRAEDLTLHRTVAIKLLHAALAADPQFQQRFMQEARTLASLKAPGLIDLYDVCEDPGPDDTPLSYLVMELVDARPLSALLADKGRLDPAELMPILAQSATALQAAHTAGIVHRDIKPANILVDEQGTVTVIDFGIARTAGGSRLTAASSIVGTVEYASPEQLGGQELTPASDIYSLGIVAYECATGDLPFAGDTAAVIAAQLHNEPPPLPDEVPPEVARVVTRALEKDPADRFESAEAMAAACRSSLSGTREISMGRVEPPARPTVQLEQDPPEPEPQSVDRLLRKRTVMTVTITLGVVLAIVVATGTAWWIGRNSSSADEAGSDSKSSGSPSATPEPPSSPSGSTLASAKTDECLGVEYGFWFDSVSLSECSGAGTQLEFVAGSGEDVVQVVNDANGDKTCVNWAYGEEFVTAGECDFGTAWTFDWVESESGYDVWQLRSVTNRDQCLDLGTEYPQGQKCADDDENQLWKTKAASGD